MDTNSSNNASSTNTVLIVIILLLLVGFGAWYFSRHRTAAPTQNPGVNVQLNLPTNDSTSAGTGTPTTPNTY